jgi:branched-chain amino acid aminotransferase
MTITANVNGQIASEQDARISVLDHGFLYGEGVYETLRTYNGVPFLFDRHMRRLRASADGLALDVPLSDDDMLGRVRETIAATGASEDDWYIRILVTRGVGDLSYDLSACTRPSVVILVKPFVPPSPETFERGVKIALVKILRNHPGSVSPLIKSNNLLNNALAMQAAYASGAYEALMRNYRGELAECSQSNFFIVKGGTALTPPVDAGLLQGITRDFLFEVGRDLGVPVRDAILKDADLETADEAFITSTTREVVPVVQVDDRVVGTGVPGPVTLTLLHGLRTRAEELTRNQEPGTGNR